MSPLGDCVMMMFCVAVVCGYNVMMSNDYFILVVLCNDMQGSWSNYKFINSRTACLPVCLLICLPVCLLVCLPNRLPVSLSVCVCVCLPVCLSVCVLVCRSVGLYVPLSLLIGSPDFLLQKQTKIMITMMVNRNRRPISRH